MAKKKTKISFAPLFVGAIAAIFGLWLNSQIPAMINLASILSPSGAQVSVYGLRIKHWIVGAFLIVSGTILLLNGKKPLTQNLAQGIFGAGIVLFVDEYQEIYDFIITGQYP